MDMQHEIVSEKINSTNVDFIRIRLSDLKQTIKDLLLSTGNKTWLSNLNYVDKNSFEIAADKTIPLLINRFSIGDVNEKTGEILISYMGLKTLETVLSHISNIPLGEIFKEQESGNPGFDYFSESSSNIIYFGEAKYAKNQNPYGVGLEQINKFIDAGTDSVDLRHIQNLLVNSALAIANYQNDDKAYSICFSLRNYNQSNLWENVKNNTYFKELIKRQFPELVIIGVSIDE